MPEAGTLAVNPDCARYILVAATELLGEVGYGAMSMRQLASRAGVLPGSLYHHVASKQDLLSCVLMDLLTSRDNAWRAFPRRRGVLGELQAFIRFCLAWQASHPLEAKVLEHEQRHLQAPVQDWLARRPGNLHVQLQKLLEKGQKQGVFGEFEAEPAALAIMALTKTADALRCNASGWSLSRLERYCLQMSWRLLDVNKAVVLQREP
ncbi:TetR/AcrR family transcriptional regulator [Pseudomonas sp. NPDC089408]|uniref:TetR/AcrR family transcriptional regulator n=1 Tax=Pseudomonas sp. NPDC089408 TaxID=3364465 RepID=UPI0037FCE449